MQAPSVRGHSEEVFEPGKPRIVAFEETSKQSQWVLLILSAEYRGDSFSKFTRVLARTLTNNYSGAIKDFQIYADETGNPQRQQWIEALRNGENPFTLKVLEGLR